MKVEPGPVRAATLVHQEGVLAMISLVVLAFREGGLASALRPSAGRVLEGMLVATVGATAVVALLHLCRNYPPLRRLRSWQARLVSGWTAADAVSVSVFSGLAEEALMRAVLQPVIGLIAAAFLFALLHLVPDRELWLWPAFALVLGIGLGVLFERYGYPAAAVAHVGLNLVAIAQLRRTRPGDTGTG